MDSVHYSKKLMLALRCNFYLEYEIVNFGGWAWLNWETYISQMSWLKVETDDQQNFVCYVCYFQSFFFWRQHQVGHTENMANKLKLKSC